MDRRRREANELTPPHESGMAVSSFANFSAAAMFSDSYKKLSMRASSEVASHTTS